LPKTSQDYVTIKNGIELKNITNYSMFGAVREEWTRKPFLACAASENKNLIE
jgi:hypothetical protein